MKSHAVSGPNNNKKNPTKTHQTKNQQKTNNPHPCLKEEMQTTAQEKTLLRNPSESLSSVRERTAI